MNEFAGASKKEVGAGLVEVEGREEGKKDEAVENNGFEGPETLEWVEKC